MARLVPILLMMGVIQASLALKCKQCKQGTECKELEDQTCAATSDPNMEPACLTQHVQDKTSHAKRLIKMCMTKTKSKDYQCQLTPNEEPDKDVKNPCATCMEDFCNSGASAARVGMLAFVAIAVSLLVPRLVA